MVVVTETPILRKIIKQSFSALFVKFKTVGFEFKVFDMFIDALDVDDSEEGNQDLLGATPYDIYYYFTESVFYPVVCEP